MFLLLAAATNAEEAAKPTPKKKAKPVVTEPTHKDVSYGAHERHKLNFWKIESDKPTPVLVHIHGGGWLGGRKVESIRGNALKAKYSQCSINYRLAGTDILPAPVMDAGRAIQFLRTKATEWNIDTDRIVCQGGSAGAASSLWLAFHADLADPKSADPVLRESSRIAGAIGIAGQTTLDPNVTNKIIGVAATRHPMIWKTPGAKSMDDLVKNWEKFKALSLECSPITHVSRDDPPVYLKYSNNTPVPVTKGDGIHHVGFGRLLKEKCDEVGVECTLELTGGKKPKFNSSEFMSRIFFK